ncbi:CHRD domain-containing protein [Streptomyces sp. NPDC004111]|uniref:CHRD domain-containing protein n=1 Tax=Streptomyces sp. NPDC004111 TaxID=3364690 RepID=UPI0036CDD6E9
MTKRAKALAIGATAVAAATGVTLAMVPASAQANRTSGLTAHAASFFAASLNGANEVPVPGGPAVGDRDGVALEFVKVVDDVVSFAVKWRGTDRPTALHIHQGARGTNGAVRIDFTKELGKGGAGRTASGSVRVTDRALLSALKADPTGFYANLHTKEFPGGAVRGQLHKVTRSFDFGRALNNFAAPVLRGSQMYRCARAAGGTTSFQQLDVRAVLAGGIAHSFVAPGSGTPQWVARDGSKVVGTLIGKSPNGAGNIPALDLAGRATGGPGRLFSRTAEILRLNTVGGVAPAGSCTPGKTVGVPYRADYVFVQR